VVVIAFTAADQRAEQWEIRKWQREKEDVYAYSTVIREESPSLKSAPEVHHIVPVGNFSNRGSFTQFQLAIMHVKLKNVGIDAKNDPHNLMTVSKGTHSHLHTDLYIAHVYSYIIAAPYSKDGIYAALDCLTIEIATIDFFAWGY